jgi:2-keto-3-deoxy-L-rhamnonate aldolase RhmA
VQILLETPTGIANAAAIAALDGVDMLGIGVNDFTAGLGVPGQYDDPRVRDAISNEADRHQILVESPDRLFYAK